MSIRYLEGFDDDVWDDFVSVTGSPTVHTDYGAHGKGIQLGDNNATALTLNLQGLSAEGVGFVIGFAVRVDDGDAGADILKFAASSDFDVRWDNVASVFKVYVDGAVTADINFTSAVVDGSEWHYHELYIVNGRSSNGTVKWHMDGGLVDEWVGTFDFGGNNMNGNAQFGGALSEDLDAASFDDIYLVDLTGGVNDDFLGPIEVVASFADGNGNTSGMSGSDGNQVNNYELVDETPPDDDTTYVSSATEGTKDTYTFDDLTGTPTVVGLTTRVTARKTDTGVKYVRPVVRSGSTDYAGTSVALGESYNSYDEGWDVDPNTSSAWTYTNVNSAEFGVEVRDS